MDIERKTCDLRTWKRHLFLDISSNTCHIALPVRRNLQNRSLLTVVSVTSAPPIQLFISHQGVFLADQTDECH
jgi:hypothetical protein